jgi:uncharacterized membrane protein
MDEGRFRVSLGFLVVGAHLCIIVLSLGLFLAGGFHLDQLVTIIAVVTPLTTVYVSAVVKYFAKSRHLDAQPAKKKLSIPYVTLTFLLGVFLLVGLMALLVLKAFNIGPLTFEVFTSLVGLCEAVIGVYFGRLFFEEYEHG